MREALVDHARRTCAQRRGGGAQRAELQEGLDGQGARAAPSPLVILVVDDALARLALVDAELARIVELRFFAGLDMAAIASVVGLSKRSVERGWRTAKAFLQLELER